MDLPGYVQLDGHRSQAVRVSVGAWHTCAIAQGGPLRCWGFGPDGQLGTGGRTNYHSPSHLVGDVQVDGLGSRAVEVAASSYHTCAILEGGRVRCWGKGTEGQLGTGNLENVLNPSNLAGDVQLNERGSRAIQVTAGEYHSCALLEGGDMRCWG